MEVHELSPFFSFLRLQFPFSEFGGGRGSSTNLGVRNIVQCFAYLAFVISFDVACFLCFSRCDVRI